MPKATVVITADNKLKKGIDPAKKTMLELQQIAYNVEKKLQKAFSIAGLATLAVKAIKSVTSAMKECVQVFSEADKVSQRLEAVWKNVGSVTNKSVHDINELASAMEKETYFTAESIKEAGLLLAATESLTEDGFDRALQASMDLAAALGEDVSTAAQTLAGALEAPEEAFKRLKTIGIAFTDEEKKQIKELTDANKLYEAQAIILGKVEDRYKDVAKAINNTPAGKLDNIKDALEDIRKALGQTLLDTISPALDSLYESLMQIFYLVASASGEGGKIANYIGNKIRQGKADEIDLSDYSTTDLLAAVTSFENSLKLDNSVQKGQGIFGAADKVLNGQLSTMSKMAETLIHQGGIAQVWKELNARGFKSIDEARKSSMGEAYVVNGTDVGESIAEETANAFTDFLKSYLPKDTFAEYTSIIETAQGYLDKFTKAVPTSKAEMIELLGLDENATGADINKAIEEGGYIPAMQSIINVFTQKLDALIPAIVDSPTLTDLDSILESYGKNSVSYQKDVLKAEYNRIAEAYEYASDEQKVYLKEILAENERQREALEELPEVLQKSFLDKFSGKLASLFEKAGLGNSTQAATAAGQAISDLTSSFGEAGEVVSTLAQNMLSMGPVLGAIVTALKYVFEGMAETFGPILNEFVKYGIEPLRELGRVIGDLLKPLLEAVMPLVKDSAESLMSVFHGIATALMPIINLIVNIVTPIFDQLANTLKFIEPIIEAIALVLASVNGVLSYVGQAIMHFVAVFLNWMAGLNIFGWKPFEGLAIKDPGSPGNFGTYMDNIYTGVQESFSKTYAGNTNADQQAIASASYRGATNVTINIYAEGPFVGDGGMRQFAQMIREEFDALDYYGVSA